jgi:2-keto-4-pentenoate hydratase/2-oxohepta-3-ene-1,7-dioic acid hydratase in catechol pathway
MKWVTFVAKGSKDRQPQVGALLDDQSVLALQPAAALYLKEVEKEKDPFSTASRLAPMDMVAFLERGKTAMNLARRTLKAVAQWQKTEKRALRGLRKEPLIFPLAKVFLKAPVPRPGKIIAMGLNFRDHAEENKVPIPELPVGFLKASSCVVGPYDPVPYPHDSTKQLDYEIEMAIVVGKKGKNVPKEKAYEYVAGYTIINDLSARDIQNKEMQKRLVLLSKSLDAFGPMGPYLVTPDEMPDPHNLGMELWVDQETAPRQKSSTNQLIYKVPDLIAYWSQMTLEPGDVITSGTPGGVAVFRQPDPQQWFLKPGDVVEARIEGLGFIRNKIV